MNIEHEFLPWKVSDRETEEQLSHQKRLKDEGKLTAAKNCYVSLLADIYDAHLTLGEDCMIGAHALIRGARVKLGKNSTVNSYAYLQGNIVAGDDVRIAPKATVCAFNHGFDDITKPIAAQMPSSKGIRIGNDVWIGTGAILLDGITVGSHVVIAAGSVVTRDVPDYTVVGGNPARVIRDRVEGYFKDRLAAFCAKVEAEAPAIIRAHERDGVYTDDTVRQPSSRALCDATEIASFFGKTEELIDVPAAVARLTSITKDTLDYTVLCNGYALECLGTHVGAPYETALALSGETLKAWLRARPWAENAWQAGSDVDVLGTAFYHSARYFGKRGDLDTLFAWLDENVDPKTGMWTKSEDVMFTVNGFYRLTRGTYAQFGRPLPLPETAMDTLLSHAATLHDGNLTACNALDVIHPLWLIGKQTDYRKTEGKEWAVGLIDKIITSYLPERGFSFYLKDTERPTLQGLEMWLSILYLVCDYLGVSHLLTYAPRGVHRTEEVGKEL